MPTQTAFDYLFKGLNAAKQCSVQVAPGIFRDHRGYFVVVNNNRFLIKMDLQDDSAEVGGWYDVFLIDPSGEKSNMYMNYLESAASFVEAVHVCYMKRDCK